MDTAEIISQIDAEISQLQGAKALLTEIPLKEGPGRPKALVHPISSGGGIARAWGSVAYRRAAE